MYKTVIFDMDGVVTSEEGYWDAAALSVAEFLGYPLDVPAQLRKEFFYDNRIIKLLKERGINSNWDLAYIVIALWNKDAQKLYAELKASEMREDELYERSAKRLAEKMPLSEAVRGGAYWQAIADSFQEWYNGSHAFEKAYHKPAHGGREGLCKKEVPIVGIPALTETLFALKEKGVSLRIATARPDREARQPLVQWGLIDLMEKGGIISYDMVEKAQNDTGATNLAKPNPYVFIKAYFGETFQDERIISGDFPKDFSDCLVVGDAGADLFAAQKMGADFAAVLTGAAGEEAREYFEKNHANYIVSDITCLPELWS